MTCNTELTALPGPSKAADSGPIAGPSNLAHPIYQSESFSGRSSSDGHPAPASEDDFLAQLELAKALSATEAAHENDLFEAQTALAISASLEGLAAVLQEPLQEAAFDSDHLDSGDSGDAETRDGTESTSKRRRAGSWSEVDDEDDSRSRKKIATEAHFDPRPIEWFCHIGEGCLVCEESGSEDSDSDEDSDDDSVQIAAVRADVDATLARCRTVTPASPSVSPVAPPPEHLIPPSLSTSPDPSSSSFDAPPIVVARERMANRLRNSLSEASSSSSARTFIDLTEDTSDSDGPTTPTSSSDDVVLLGLGLSGSLPHAAPPLTDRKPRVHIERVDIDLTVDDSDDEVPS